MNIMSNSNNKMNLFDQNFNDQLIHRMIELTKKEGETQTPIPHLYLYRSNTVTRPIGSLHDASLCMIVQGEKQVIFGNESYIYNAQHFLFTTVDLPVIAHIIDASPQKPYLTIVLKLDPHLLTQLMLESKIPLKNTQKPSKSITIGQVTKELSNAFLRLLNLFDDQYSLPLLSPLIIKEIYYRLLLSPQGEQLKYIAAIGTAGHRVIKAIQWLKNNFTETLSINDLAEQIGMSPSSFYQHFKAMTSMSPLQYQKRLRLSKARQLLLTAQEDITSVSMHVGYESSSQFSREYKRFFGITPSLDIKQFIELI